MRTIVVCVMALLFVSACLGGEPDSWVAPKTKPINFAAWDAPKAKTKPIDFSAWDPPKVRTKPINFDAWDAPRKHKLIQVGTIQRRVCTPYGYCRTVEVPQFAEVEETD